MIIYSGIFVLGSIKNVFLFAEYEEAKDIMLQLAGFVVIGFLSWIVFKALKHPELFEGIDSKLPLVRDLELDLKANEKSKLATEEDLGNKPDDRIMELRAYMDREEPFLDPDLTIHQLATRLKIPLRDLSLLINRDLNQHFFDFINAYRIKKAKEILVDASRSDHTVLEILYAVGFNSKSSFNTAFKRQTGVTPTQYRISNTLPAS